jgi:hypothetical protein
MCILEDFKLGSRSGELPNSRLLVEQMQRAVGITLVVGRRHLQFVESIE